MGVAQHLKIYHNAINIIVATLRAYYYWEGTILV